MAEIHNMANSADVQERKKAVKQLRYNFASFSDKDTAWSDLHQLTHDESEEVRGSVAHALSSCFSAVPDKAAAWSDLHRLTQDDDFFVRWCAAEALGLCFSTVSDKDTAWSDLHRLTHDKSEEVRGSAADALNFCFSAVPDKAAAWSDLIRLTTDWGKAARRNAEYALHSCFSAVPDKDTVWSDLIRLTEISYLQHEAISLLGSCFSDVSDKDTAMYELLWLTQNDDSDMRMYAHHSLGCACVYKATETVDEEKFRDELKKAIDYFEQSSNEADDRYWHPAQFCLPFYRTYYAVISEKQDAEAEAAKYLFEAKKATGGVEGREILLEAVENLANALKEAQKPLDFNERQEHLRACRQYCDHTTELANNARGKSPVAAEAIMRGIAIVGVKVKKIIAEIQAKAKEACQQAKGTPAEDITCAVNQEVQKWVIGNQEVMTHNVEKLILLLKSRIPQIPQNKHIYEEIEKIREESDITKQYDMVLFLIAFIPTSDTTIISNVTVGDNSQLIGKGNYNKNTNEKAPDITHKLPKTSIFIKKSKN